MSFKETFEKITDSKAFANFIQEKSDAEFVAGFFILDFLSNDNKKTLDYKSGDKIYTFSLNNRGEITIQEDKLLDTPDGKNVLTKIENPDLVKVELDELKGITGIQALDNGISSKIHKIIAVLHNQNQQLVWNLTCMLENLIILNIIIDSSTGNIIKFDRRSMMDMIKKK